MTASGKVLALLLAAMVLLMMFMAMVEAKDDEAAAAVGDKMIRGSVVAGEEEKTVKNAAAAAGADGTAPVQETKLLQVTTLTRHGSRAPDKILATVSCQPLLEKAHPAEPLSAVFVNKFGTIPGELTQFGETQMEEVGRFIKQRYGKNDLDFVNTDDFNVKTTDWEFIARAGSRQQRSMMAIAQGLFSGTAVPIAVTDRSADAVLGGPAPQCGSRTAKMIVDWHSTTGKQLVNERYETAVAPFEKLCNVSLHNNPVNAAPGGPNPHAWIGDISDLLDSMRENVPQKDQPEYSEKSYKALTELAFDLEQRSHYDDPRGTIMFAGDFPNKLLTTLESIEKNDNHRPKGVPKMRMYACSRELEYGLSHMFGWEQGIRLPKQPPGRVLPGSTIIWELWRINGELWVDTLMFQPGVKGLLELQERTKLADYRKEYLDAIKDVGTWKQVCEVKDPSYLEEIETHGKEFWFALFVIVVIVAAIAYRRGFKRGGYQAIN